MTKRASPKPLTLKLDGELQIEDFKNAVDAFCELVKAVAADMPQGQHIRWKVQVKEGSNIIQLLPTSPRTPIAQLNQVVQTIEKGVSSLAAGRKKRPLHFTDNAMKHTKKLAKIANSDLFISLKTNEKQLLLSAQVTASVDAYLEPHYQDYGSTEGELVVVSASDYLVFYLVDAVTQQKIRCIVPEELETRVLSAFRKRVMAWGLIKYRADGLPVSIQVDDFKVFQADADLPSIDDFLSSLPTPKAVVHAA